MTKKQPFEELLHRTPAEECRTAAMLLLSDGVPVSPKPLVERFGIDLAADVLRAMGKEKLCHVGECGDVPMLVPGPEPKSKTEEPPDYAPAPPPVPPKLPPVKRAASVQRPRKVPAPLATTPAALPPESTVSEIASMRMAIALEQLVAVMASTVSVADFTPRHDAVVVDVLRRIVVVLTVRGPMMQTAIRRTALSSRRGRYIPEAVILGVKYGVLDVGTGFRSPIRVIDHTPVMTDKELDTEVREQLMRDEMRRLN